MPRSYNTYRIVETALPADKPDIASGVIMNGLESRRAAEEALRHETEALINDGCTAIPSEAWECLIQFPNGSRVGYQILLNVWE